MVSSTATTATAYLAALPADRRAVISAVRDVVNAHLPPGYVEGIQYGMLAWFVPLERYPDTYNGNPIGIGGLAAQKHYNALYLTGVYSDLATEKWFKAAYAKSGKKLDIGKSCVRFKTLDDLPLDVIGAAIARLSVEDLIARHDAVHGGSKNKIRAMSARTTKKEATKPTPKPKKKPKPKPKKKPKR